MKIDNMMKEHTRIFNYLLSKYSIEDKKKLIHLIELEHQLTKEEIQ